MNCPYCKEPFFQKYGFYSCDECRISRFDGSCTRIELVNKSKTFAAVSYLDNDNVLFYSKSTISNWRHICSMSVSYDTFIKQITPNNIDNWKKKINRLQAFL